MGTWDVRQTIVSGELAIGPDKAVTREVTELGVLMFKGVVVRVLLWSLQRGTYPHPWEMGVRVKLIGLLIVLCHE